MKLNLRKIDLEGRTGNLHRRVSSMVNGDNFTDRNLSNQYYKTKPPYEF